MNSVLVISIACCVFVLPYCEAIKCYNCLAVPEVPNARKGSRDNSWPFPPPKELCTTYGENVLMDCGSSGSVCHSIILDVDADAVDKVSMALKVCGNSQTTQLCDTLGTRSASVKGSCYTCSTDGCNSASLTALNISIILGAAAIFKLFH